MPILVPEVWLSLGLVTESSEQAEAAIREMRGRVQRDDKRPDNPTVSVRLSGVWVTNVGLVHLKALDQVECVSLSGSDVYDSSLSYFRNLRQLRRLTYSNTWITGSGLIHLAGLPRLEYLDLSFDVGVTDAAVEYLKIVEGA